MQNRVGGNTELSKVAFQKSLQKALVWWLHCLTNHPKCSGLNIDMHFPSCGFCGQDKPCLCHKVCLCLIRKGDSWGQGTYRLINAHEAVTASRQLGTLPPLHAGHSLQSLGVHALDFFTAWLHSQGNIPRRELSTWSVIFITSPWKSGSITSDMCYLLEQSQDSHQIQGKESLPFGERSVSHMIRVTCVMGYITVHVYIYIKYTFR